MFTYTDFTVRFIETHFNQPDGHDKFYENIVQYFPPDWIIGFVNTSWKFLRAQFCDLAIAELFASNIVIYLSQFCS
jgi:hypothetical protein